jgi:Tol biopolymer transport system component
MKLLRVTCCLFVLLLSLVAFAFVAVHPAWAKVPGPNGRIAFDRFDPATGDGAVFTANPDGTDEVQLLLPPHAGFLPRWAPDGSKIVVGAANPEGLFRPATINPDGSGFTLLDNPDPSLYLVAGAWSSDGARLACEGWDDVHPDRTPGVFTVRSSDGGDLVRLTANPFGGHDIPGDYSPDGTRIVFSRGNPPLHDTNALFVVNADGTGLRQLTPWGLASGSADWSPDGSKIVFAGAENRPKGPLWVINPDGTGLRKIFQDTQGGVAFAPVWSPDGTKILFARNPAPRQGGQNDLYTINPDGTGLTQVTHTPDFEDFPDWGPSQG